MTDEKREFDPRWPHGHVTRDGRKARILADDLGVGKPLAVAVKDFADGYSLERYRLDGTWSSNKSTMDLFNAPPLQLKAGQVVEDKQGRKGFVTHVEETTAAIAFKGAHGLVWNYKPDGTCVYDKNLSITRIIYDPDPQEPKRNSEEPEGEPQPTPDDGPMRVQPEVGSVYWFLLADGRVLEDQWNASTTCHTIFRQGNCYPSKESAVRAAKRARVIHRLWQCEGAGKFRAGVEQATLHYNWDSRRWGFYFRKNFQDGFELPCFDTGDHADAALKALGSDLDVLL